MPRYRIVSESDPLATNRTPRGAVTSDRRVTIINARSVLEALYFSRSAAHTGNEDHHGRRIISIEEVHPGFTLSDDEITAALTSPVGDWPDEPMIDKDSIDPDEIVYDTDDFLSTVQEIATAIRESELIPGFDISLLSDTSGVIDYAMVDIRDEERGIYLSRGCEIKQLTEDCSAAGWEGVLAIARQLIALANDLH